MFESLSSNLRGPISDSDPDFESKASPAEKRTIKAAEQSGKLTEKDVRENLDIDDSPIAKFKIEVTFSVGRTVQGPNMCGIRIWESGKRFHGGGDDLIMWCKDSREGKDGGCWAPILSDNIRAGFAYCKNCKRTVNADHLTDMKIGRVSSQNLAKNVALLFRQLGSSADVYLKYHKTDIRYVAMEKAKGPEVAARLKGMHIYTLDRILRDTVAGADLEGRIKAFITS